MLLIGCDMHERKVLFAGQEAEFAKSNASSPEWWLRKYR
jgi:hypothetical protein